MPYLRILELEEKIKIEPITVEDLELTQKRCITLLSGMIGVELSENQENIKSLLEKVKSYGPEKIEELNHQSITNLTDIITSMSKDDRKYFTESYKIASQNLGFSGIHFKILPEISNMMELEEFASATMAESQAEPQNHVNLTLHDEFYNSYFDLYPLKTGEDTFKNITLIMLHEFSHIHDNNDFLSSKDDSIVVGNNVLDNIPNGKKMDVLKKALEIVDPLYPTPTGDNITNKNINRNIGMHN